jgi:hypothetical protein
MDTIEQQVRDGLAEREKRKFLEYVSKHPKLRSKVDKALRRYKEDLFNLFIEIFEVEPGEQEKLARVILELQFGPYLDRLRENVYEEFAKSIGEIYRESYEKRKEKIEREADKIKLVLNLDELKPLMGKIEEYHNVIDEMVARLSEMARERGVDEALRDETIYATIRGLFPTKQLYKKHLKLRQKIEELSSTRLGELFNFGGLLKYIYNNETTYDETIIEEFNAIGRRLIASFKPINDVLLKAYIKMKKEEIDKIYKEKK